MASSYEANKRWRAAKPAQWQAQKKRNYDLTRGSHNRRRTWSSEEDRQILESAKSDVSLSKEMKRSVKAIHVRRAKLKKAIEQPAADSS